MDKKESRRDDLKKNGKESNDFEQQNLVVPENQINRRDDQKNNSEAGDSSNNSEDWEDISHSVDEQPADDENENSKAVVERKLSVVKNVEGRKISIVFSSPLESNIGADEIALKAGDTRNRNEGVLEKVQASENNPKDDISKNVPLQTDNLSTTSGDDSSDEYFPAPTSKTDENIVTADNQSKSQIKNEKDSAEVVVVDLPNKIGISKEAEDILTTTTNDSIKIDSIEEKPYEAEDAIEEIIKKEKAIDEEKEIDKYETQQEETGDKDVENDETKPIENKNLETEIDAQNLDDSNEKAFKPSNDDKSENKHENVIKKEATESDGEEIKNENHVPVLSPSTQNEAHPDAQHSDEYSGSNSDIDGIENVGRKRTSLRQLKRKHREATPRPNELGLALTNNDQASPEKPPRQHEEDPDTTTMKIKVTPPTPGEKLEKYTPSAEKFIPTTKSEFDTAPGPEEFHEVAIDVPNIEKRRITFDIDDDGSEEMSNSFKKKLADDDGEDEGQKQTFEKSRLEKILNILLCRKDLVDAKLAEQPVKFWDLFKYGSRLDTILVIMGLILAALCGICQPLFAIISGNLANTLLLIEIEDPQFIDDGTRACVMFVIIGTFLVVVAFAQFLCFNIACTRITRRIRNAYLRSILRQNPAWFEKNHSGALNTKLNDNIERIYEGIGDKLGLLTRNMVQYIAGIIVALFTNWQMTVPLLIFSPIITFTMAFSSRKITQASRDEMKIYGGAGCIAEEAITAYRTVAAFNAQETEVARYKKELDQGVRQGTRKAMYAGALSGILVSLVFIFMGTALLYGTFLHSIGIVKTPGEVFVVLLAIMSGSYHLGNASPHLMVLLTARVAAASVYKTILRIPKIDPYSEQGRKLYDLQGKIIFKNVSFRYPSRPKTKVLKSFSFSCNAGQTIALVGQSGSGKSTIVGILNRLYEFESGNVSLDGVDIRELNVKWLRTVIGTVQQEPIIFNDSVENNIKLGCDSLTEKEMVEACKMANAHDFIESLPEGYNTRIGEGGVQLSGGQKQRIAIARTLARNPKILLLDEATSALDTHSEAMVQAALNNASKNRTTIVIAHRLSTIRDADRIIVMHKGRFVEMGTHNDLLARKGAYAKLVQAQVLNMGDGDEKKNGEIIEDDLLSPDQPTSNLTMASKVVRESVRQSFQRDFMVTDHMGDAETEAYNIEIEKVGAKKASFGQILLDAKELWPLLGVAIAICCFNALSMPLNAFIYGKAFQLFENGRKDNVGDAFMFFLFFVGLGIVAMIAAFFTTYLFGKIGEKLTMSMRVRAFRSIIHQDGSYFDNPAHTPGKLITRLATDAPNVKASMDTRLARVVQGFLALFTSIIISVFMDWKFGLACSSFFIVLGIFQFTIARIAHSHALKFAQGDEAGRIAIEAIENVRTIQLLTSELAIHKVFMECSLKRQRAETRKSPIEAINFATTHGLQQFTLAFCYMVGFIFVLNGLTDKITLFQVVQTIYFGAASIMQATEFFPEFVKSKLAASLMYKIINRQPRTGRLDAGEKISIEGDVTFENVYFAYPMRPKHAVMKGISLQARPGQTLAMVGPSGSGKSTVIALLERFYDPSVGAVKIDGKDLKSLNLWEIRRQMSLVEQQPRLFSGTIKENIAYGLNLNEISMDEIIDAANLANAASFISTLPLGYDTPLGEKGAQLSGGQKQRIAIARAVIRKPKILLLDEATSALDSSSEKAVQDALDKARLGRTCITIAHRLSSIQNSDAIIFVENGKVRERGTHLELVQQQGKYYNLTQQQYLGAH